MTEGSGLIWVKAAPKSVPEAVQGSLKLNDVMWMVIGKKNGLNISIGGIDGQVLGEIDRAPRREPFDAVAC